MNINDNKLNELIEKTEKNIKNKTKRRRYITASSLAAAVVIIFALVFRMGNGIVPDVVIGIPSESLAINKNSNVDPEAWNDWSESRVINGVEISINAEFDFGTIVRPQETRKIYKIQRDSFSLEDAHFAVDYFIGNKYYNYDLIKPDFEKLLASAQYSLSTLSLNEQEKKTAQTRIKSLRNAILNASDSLKPAKLEFELHQNSNILYVRGLDDNYIPEFSVSNQFNIPSSLMRYSKEYYNLTFIEYDKAFHPVYSSHLTEQETKEFEKAEVTATSIVKDITDEDDFSLCSFYTKGVVYDGNFGNATLLNNIDYNILDKFYIFYFTRRYDYVFADFSAPTHPSINKNNFDSFEYEKLTSDLFNEYIRIAIYKDKLLSFSWNNKTTTLSTQTMQTSSLSYAEYENIFKKEIFNLANNFESGSKTIINVSEVLYRMVQTEDENGNILMIPAYIIKGTQKAFDPNGNLMIDSKGHESHTLLKISLIDGSIIE